MDGPHYHALGVVVTLLIYSFNVASADVGTSERQTARTSVSSHSMQ